MQNMMSTMARGQTEGQGDDEDDTPDLANLMATMLNGEGLKKGQRINKNAINQQIKRKNQITEMKNVPNKEELKKLQK